MNRIKYILSGIFLVLIATPMVGDLTGLTTGEVLEENQFIKGYEQLSLPEKAALYIKNFDRQFWGREDLVKAFIVIKRDIFCVSPLPEKVVMGKVGWLFLADYGAMDDYRNVRPFTQSQLDSIQVNLKRIALELEKNDKKFYVVVVPDKHTIYPEYLPENVKKIRPVSRLQQLTGQLKNEASFRFINLTDTLLASKREGLLYLKEESHWNDLGSFVGCQKIIETLQRDYPEIRTVTLDSCQSFNGKETDLDLAKLLGADIGYSEDTWRIVPRNLNHIKSGDAGVVIPPAKRFNASYAFRNINSGSDGPEIIVYRDSFFGSLVPFFEQSFSASTYIWTNDIDLEYVRQQSASIVLLEIAERHIDLLAD
ncbi:MAG TPA: hypothetical protein VFU05_14845 [Cyclobacteriaceae bacterium]|nr:hypothetical protein [Cyclobacteriaceae bacterium]